VVADLVELSDGPATRALVDDPSHIDSVLPLCNPVDQLCIPALVNGPVVLAEERACPMAGAIRRWSRWRSIDSVAVCRGAPALGWVIGGHSCRCPSIQIPNGIRSLAQKTRRRAPLLFSINISKGRCSTRLRGMVG
jgi:hypothetical protein